MAEKLNPWLNALKQLDKAAKAINLDPGLSPDLGTSKKGPRSGASCQNG
jgi:hypothetical protein